MLINTCQPVHPLLIATGEAIPLRGLEGVPGLPGAPQDEAGLTRKFETSHVGGPGWRRSPGEGNDNPLQYSCLENPMDGEA